jgi:hypothetical protein
MSAPETKRRALLDTFVTLGDEVPRSDDLAPPGDAAPSAA